MRMFKRKRGWRRAVATMTRKSAKKPALKTGAVALTGIVTAVAASAAVSSARRRSES
jgi:hypothetical protein